MKLLEYTLKNRAGVIVNAYKIHMAKGGRVLDVGCGNGVISKILSDNFGCKITGTDILDYNKVGLDFKQMKGDGELPFADNSFDIVMFNDMLHHVSKGLQIVFIKEALRIGKRVLIFELKPTLYAKFTDWLANKVHNWEMNIPLTQRTLGEWEAMFKENDINFKSVEIKRSFPSNPFRLSYEHLAELLYCPVTNYCFQLDKDGRN